LVDLINSNSQIATAREKALTAECNAQVDPNYQMSLQPKEKLKVNTCKKIRMLNASNGPIQMRVKTKSNAEPYKAIVLDGRSENSNSSDSSDDQDLAPSLHPKIVLNNKSISLVKTRSESNQNMNSFHCKNNSANIMKQIFSKDYSADESPTQRRNQQRINAKVEKRSSPIKPLPQMDSEFLNPFEIADQNSETASKNNSQSKPIFTSYRLKVIC